jgi:hypothetical protein
MSTTSAKASATAAASSSPQVWGPPFTNPWGWMPAAAPAGYWIVPKPDAWNGGWVQQMGSNAHPASAPLTQGDLLVAFLRDVTLPAGMQSFLARLELGPVSLIRRNGGASDAYVFLQVTGPGFNWVDLRPAVSNSVMYLDVTPPVALKAGSYRIRFGGYVIESYQGSQETYAEIINKRTEILYYPPSFSNATLAASSLRHAAAEMRLPEHAGGVPVHHFTPEEAAGHREILAPLAS